MKKSILYLIFGLWLIACLSFLGEQISKYYFACDDSFISFRYARNLVNGDGLVFNVGEKVEGYSNFLWVLLSSPSFLFSISPDTWANSLSLCATLLLLFALWSVVKREHDLRSAAIIFGVAVMYLSFNRSFAVWATSGLEMRLFSLFLFAAIATSPVFGSSKKWIVVSSALFALAALTRMESYLFFGEITLLELVLMRAYRNWSRKDYVNWFAPFLIVAVIHLVFRLLYYGYPLPNTFYVKVGGAHFSWGGKYLLAFVLEYQIWLLVPLFTIGIVGRDLISRALRKIALIFLPYIVYLAYIGGDHFEFRMFDILLPFVALTLGVAVKKLTEWHVPLVARAVLAVGAAVVVAFATLVIPLTGEKAIKETYQVAATPEVDFGRFPKLRIIPGFETYCDFYHSIYAELTNSLSSIRAEEHRLFAQKVKRQADLLNGYIARGVIEPNPTVSLMCVGIIPYYTNLPTIDYNGLTDSHIAHLEASENPVVGRILLAHEKNADWEYLQERGVDYIFSVGFGFFTSQDPLPITLPDTYIVRLPDNYFSFRTPLSRDEIVRRFQAYGIMYRSADNRLSRVN